MTTENPPPTGQDEAQRVRGYLIAQANKLSLPELAEKVRRDVLPLHGVIRAVPTARFTERPDPEEWSAAEVMTHVLAMNETGARAIEGIIAGGALAPTIRDAIEPGGRPDLDGADAYWRVFEERRERLLARAITARGDEHLDLKITHSMFGAFSWREWLLFMRVHDLDHLRQVQAITARFGAAS